MAGPVLTVKAAAEYCGVAARTLYNLKYEGTGPTAYKHGRLTVYFTNDLDAWLTSRLAVSAPGE